MSKIRVIKRNGKHEDLNIDKIHKVLFWATQGLKNVSVSDIEVNAGLQFKDGIKTTDIHEVLINSAVDLITNKTPEYSQVASRLKNYLLRKNTFGDVNNLPTLFEVVTKNTAAKVYDDTILKFYSKKELDQFNDLIKHERDYEMTFAGIQQCCDKYLCKDRINDKFYETPQFAFMAIALAAFAKEPKDKRFDLVRRLYNAISTFKINLPTPVIAGLRTALRQYSSCTLIDVGDSLEGILNAQYSVGQYAAKRAGIGLNLSRIRGLDEPIRNGEVKHTGVIPILKSFQGTTKAFVQGGVRTGSTTVHFPFFHKEILSILVLKNNKGTDDNRVRQLDYSIQFNELFFKRCAEDGFITLFPTGGKKEYIKLHDAFFKSNEEFEAIYTELERETAKNKKIKRIKARELFTEYCKERFETGRLYAFFSDNVNQHGYSNKPLPMSNLCQEITLPVKPLEHHTDILNDGQDCPGEIALCVLGGINMGAVDFNNHADMEDVCDIVVRLLDNVIEYQDYPVNAARKMLKRRSIGVGVVNFAYWLAKKKLGYNDSKETLEAVDEAFESFQYHLLKASNELAKERGQSEYFHDTKYADGLLPIDWYKKTVDNLVKRKHTFDWETLRKNIETYGLRNNTLSAIMPAESSSVTSNATNGIEPPLKPVVIKGSKISQIKIAVPEVKKLEGYYTYAFEQYGNKGMLSICAVIQKWIDQSISTNCYYDPKAPWRETEGIKMSEVGNDIIFAWKHGIKTLYYSNTNDNAKEDQSGGCGSGGCTL